ncbi:MAG: diguanylate cyclase [Planctomycetaceae bacterium]|nr:diguanylate cyclase [Planctomycetaceae bacterium]
MKPLSSTSRIVVGLVSLAISSVLVASLIGLIPDSQTASIANRAAFCESTSISFMAMAPRMSAAQVQETLQQVVNRQPEIDSLGIRQLSNELAININDHSSRWDPTDVASNNNQFIVPISADGQPWGQMEVRFKPTTGPFGLPVRFDIALVAFMGVGLSIGFYFYLQRVLKHLNPSHVVPPRVREALDALAEGLLVLDLKKRIVLANKAFSHCTNISVDAWIGKDVGMTGFQIASEATEPHLPWEATLRGGQPIRGVLMKLFTEGREKTFSVSAVPIHDDRNNVRGVVTSFEDVTVLDQKQRELKDALTSLKQSSEEVRQQNRELEWLATRDALTGCVNRRSFFKIFEEDWDRFSTTSAQCCAMMVDIDHFKSINDNHGHAMGDEVLRRVAAAVMQTVTDPGVVCRYGGEEFSVFLPETDLDEAEMVGERIRLAIMSLKISSLKITASLGVASTECEATSPQDLLDKADKCLYVAKRHGRNQVIRYDKAQQQIAALGDSPAPIRRENAEPQKSRAANRTIPFQAVSALVSALSFRDHRTAAHCRRVADLCVATAEGLLSMKDCYNLELAALLHDIGKIGIPDNILHKSGKLTDEEWEIMKRHHSVGVRLVKSSFASSVLTEIMEQQSLWFDLSNAGHAFPEGTRPTLSARILSIADAYDSMSSEANYRRRLTPAEAFSELRKCAGTQFDPELVERFITAVKLQNQDQHSLPQVSTDTALDIGLQIERFVTALDDQNTDDLKELTDRLHHTAVESGIDHMAHVTEMLKQALDEGNDIIEVMQIANELLDLCRLTQVSLIQSRHSGGYYVGDPELASAC